MSKMRLGAFLIAAGHHRAAWRHQQTHEATETDIQHFVEMAKISERGLFDLMFLADSTAPWGPYELELQARTNVACTFEPLSLLSALAMVTKRIGLVATSTTTFDEPYLVARKFASLDQISRGRAGWNLVTSVNSREAYNFGRTAHVAHADRYDRASEFADVVLGLWDSWDEDAFMRDRESGRYFDPAKMHFLNHEGKHFSVKGPVNVVRSPQGRPIVVQAGSSEPGRQLSARVADIAFTVQQQLDKAQEFYADIKRRAASFGRDPDSILVMPGLSPVIGSTEAEANRKLDELNDLISPETGVAELSTLVGMDLSSFPLDGPLPEITTPGQSLGRQKVTIDLARRENLTIRQLYRRVVALRAHLTVIGTPEQVADKMEEWFRAKGADGFNVMPPMLPSGMAEFVDQVIPILQKRGLFRTSYEGATLRENLGLAKPVSRYANQRAAE